MRFAILMGAYWIADAMQPVEMSTSASILLSLMLAMDIIEYLDNGWKIRRKDK